MGDLGHIGAGGGKPLAKEEEKGRIRRKKSSRELGP